MRELQVLFVVGVTVVAKTVRRGISVPDCRADDPILPIGLRCRTGIIRSKDIHGIRLNIDRCDCLTLSGKRKWNRS